MNNPLKNVGDYIIPGALIIVGLLVVFSSVVGRQNEYWLLGGALIFIVGLFAILMKLGVLSNSIQKILFFAFIPLAFITAYFAYRSIQAPIEFNIEKKKRYAKVDDKLKTIRTWQLAYKTVYRSYAADFDTLITFINTDSFPVIMALGTVPDTLTEQQAVDLGLVTRDTIMVSVKDSLFKSEGDINQMRIIPYSDQKEFNLDAGSIEKGQVAVPVFEASALNADIFFDIEPEYYDPQYLRKVGSMTEPSTSGNWE